MNRDLQITQESPNKLLINFSDALYTCVGSPESIITYDQHPNRVELYFSVLPEFTGNEKDNDREVALYIDISGEIKHTISGSPATTFKFGDEIVLTAEKVKYTICFGLEEGSGNFVGHLARGSRPATFPVQGRQRAPLCDWQLFLRTLRRVPKCRFKISIQRTDR